MAILEKFCMNAEIQRTVGQLSSVSADAGRLTLAVYATRRAGWGAPLDVFFASVAPVLDAALTALDATAAECELTPQHQVAMLLRYLDTTPPEAGVSALLDQLHYLASESRRAREAAELEAFAAAAANRPLPPPPSAAVSTVANTVEAQTALQHAASVGYVPPVATVPSPSHTPPTPPAPILVTTPLAPAPVVVTAPAAAVVAHAPTPPEWHQPAPLAEPAPPPPAAPTTLAAGTRVAYQLGPEALTATVIAAGAGHATIRTDSGAIYESVSWQYLHPTAAPLIVAVTLPPTTASQLAALAAGAPAAPAAQGTVLCGVACVTVAEPGTGRECRLLLDVVAGPQSTQPLLSLRLETAQHEILASATYMCDALQAPGALRLQHKDCTIGLDLTIPAATTAAVPAKRTRGTKKTAAETAPLPGQGTLPLADAAGVE
jgi:hypothetical protein